MKKYEFRLQRVKRVRAVEEDMSRARFGAAESAAREAELRADERQAAIARAVDELRGLQGTPVLEPSSVIAALGLVDDARTLWKTALEEARALRNVAEEHRREWQARKRAIEGLERLDERSRVAHVLESERNEALANDEAAMQRDARARRHASTMEGR